MVDIDYDAMNLAAKILIIFFIITIILTNFYLIFKLVRQQGFRYRPKNLVLISLAFGDIFLALFPLPMEAKFIFETTFNISCRTFNAASTYLYYLIHFVYGIGLITLAVELSLRYRGQPAVLNTSPVRGFAYSAVPWVLGLIIVLPLAMADFNYYYCFTGNYTNGRQIATLVISVLMPSFLSIIVCFIVYCKRFDAGQNRHSTLISVGSTYGSILATQNTTHENQHISNSTVPPSTAQMPYIQPAYNQYSTQNFQQQNIYPQSQTPYIQPAYNQYPTQYTQQQNMYPPAAQYAPSPYPATEQVNQTNVVIPAPNYQFQTQNTAAPSVEDPSREKKILLIAAIIYSLFVLPNAIYRMGTLVPNYSASSIDIVLSETFGYLMIFRSLVTPCLFVSSFKK